MAQHHSVIRHEGTPSPAGPQELARTAGRAVALVAALRRLRQRRRVERHTHGIDQPPEKG